MPALVNIPGFRATDSNGSPISGARLYGYATGTTTPIIFYLDGALTTPTTWPAVADSSGLFPDIYAADAQIRVELKNASDVEIADVDPYISGGLILAVNSYTRPAVGAVARTLLDKLGDDYSVKDFGATGDGVTDDTAAIQAAFDAAPAAGAFVFFPPGVYRTTATLTGKSWLHLFGSGPAPGYGGRAKGSVIKRDHNSALITFPGGTTVFPVGDGMGWSIGGMTFDGDDRNAPIINAPEGIPGRGSFNVQLIGNGFYNSRPAIYAENCWDWTVDSNAFVACGNAATGTGNQKAAIYLYNSDQSYTGANTNVWHIRGNFFDAVTGIGIQADSSGIGQCIQNLTIKDNHFGPTGYQAIVGQMGESIIEGNQFEGTTAGLITVQLAAATGSGRNKIRGNLFEAGGLYHIETANPFDEIVGNTLLPQASAGYYIRLTAASSSCFVTGNVTNDTTAPLEGTPCVNDQGTDNRVFMNGGLDGLVQRWRVSGAFATAGMAESTDTSASSGPVWDLYRNSASPANSDGLGWLQFSGRSSTGVKRGYAGVAARIISTTNGAENGQLEFNVIHNGVVETKATIGQQGAQFVDPVRLAATTVAGLAAYSVAGGERAYVFDSTVAGAGNFGAAVAGGGLNGVPVYYNGSSWRIG